MSPGAESIRVVHRLVLIMAHKRYTKLRTTIHASLTLYRSTAQIFSLSDLYLGVEKTIFKEIMHFHYITYMDTPQLTCKNPCPRGHEIYNFGRPFLEHHNFILSLSVFMSRSREENFKRNNAFSQYLATPQRKNPCPGSHEIYNYNRPFRGHHYYIDCT